MYKLYQLYYYIRRQNNKLFAFLRKTKDGVFSWAYYAYDNIGYIHEKTRVKALYYDNLRRFETNGKKISQATREKIQQWVRDASKEAEELDPERKDLFHYHTPEDKQKLIADFEDTHLHQVSTERIREHRCKHWLNRVEYTDTPEQK